MINREEIIKPCPRCIEYLQKGYKAGYEEAMKLIQNELKLAYLSRPIQIRIEAKESEVKKNE